MLSKGLVSQTATPELSKHNPKRKITHFHNFIEKPNIGRNQKIFLQMSFLETGDQQNWSTRSFNPDCE